VSRLRSSGVQSTGSCTARAHQLACASHAHMVAASRRCIEALRSCVAWGRELRLDPTTR